jgi:hypothetical protein
MTVSAVFTGAVDHIRLEIGGLVPNVAFFVRHRGIRMVPRKGPGLKPQTFTDFEVRASSPDLSQEQEQWRDFVFSIVIQKPVSGARTKYRGPSLRSG